MSLDRRSLFALGLAATADSIFSFPKANAQDNNHDPLQAIREKLARDGVKSRAAYDANISWLPNLLDERNAEGNYIYRRQLANTPKGLFTVPLNMVGSIARFVGPYRTNHKLSFAGAAIHIGGGVFLTDHHVLDGMAGTPHICLWRSNTLDIVALRSPDLAGAPRSVLWLGSGASYLMAIGADTGVDTDGAMPSKRVWDNPARGEQEFALLASLGYSPLYAQRYKVEEFGRKYNYKTGLFNVIVRKGMSGGSLLEINPFNGQPTSLTLAVISGILSDDPAYGVATALISKQVISFVRDNIKIWRWLPLEVRQEINHQLAWQKASNDLHRATYFLQKADNPSLEVRSHFDVAVRNYATALEDAKKFTAAVQCGLPEQLAFQIASILEDMEQDNRLLTGQPASDYIAKAAMAHGITPEKHTLWNNPITFFSDWTKPRETPIVSGGTVTRSLPAKPAPHP